MAYYSGVANSPASLRDSILANLATSGWTVSGVEFYKDCLRGVFQDIPTIANYTDLVAQFTYRDPVSGTLGPTTDSPIGFGFGSFTVFPISFEMFVFDNPLECHIVINYNTEFYQIWSFGITHVDNPDGYPWVSGTYRRIYNNITIQNLMNVRITYEFVSSEVSTGCLNPAMFIPAGSSTSTPSTVFATANNTSATWRPLVWNSTLYMGGLLSVYLCGTPTNQNANNLLCPVMCTYSVSPNSTYIIADMSYARLTRNDNILPGDIIEFGEDRWKVFPVFRRNTAVRDGEAFYYRNHSGTLAAAFKYEGP